jgi:hypothetical protein
VDNVGCCIVWILAEGLLVGSKKQEAMSYGSYRMCRVLTGLLKRHVLEGCVMVGMTKFGYES